MKKLIVLALFVPGVFGAYGQGDVDLSTAAGANTKFMVTEAGERIGGEAWRTQFFYANGAVTDEISLEVVGMPVHPRTGIAAGVLPAGTLRLEKVDPAGGVATLQVRAWSAVLGSTWDSAYANWLQGPPGPDRYLGKSALFQVNTRNPASILDRYDGMIRDTFPGLTLYLVPEPPVVAFCVLSGIAALAFVRRRSREQDVWKSNR